MKRFLAAAIFFGAAVSFAAVALVAHASEVSSGTVKAQPAPSLVFEEAQHDFGKMGENQTVKHTFKFKNEGDATLVIGDIKTTCGCTGTLLSQREIPPGGEGFVEVSYHSGTIGGQRRKSVFVKSNDPQHASVKLDIMADVIVPVEVKPRMLYWVAERNEKSMRTIELLYNPDLKVDIQKIEISSPAFSASYRPEDKPDVKGYAIDIDYDGSLPIGNIQEKVVILTDNQKYPKIEVGLRGKVVGPVKVIPDAVALGVIKADQLPVRTFRVYDTAKNDFAITSVESTSPLLSYKMNQKGNPKKYEISVKLTEMPPVGAFSERLIIKTNDPSAPIIEVPVYAYVK